MAKKVRCHRCKYVWDYTGNNFVANCPKCRTQVRIKYYNPEPAKEEGVAKDE